MSDFPNDPRENPGIKRSFYPLPEENPESWRCVEVHIPAGDEYMELLRTALKSLTLWFNYSRDASHRGKLIADRFAYALQLPELGCDMNCEELMECLAPLFESVESISQNLEELKQQIEQQIAENGAKGTALPEVATASASYAGALALVQAMDRNNRKLYEEAELSAVDNTAEWIGQILDLFPNFSAQGVGAGADLANAYFENQVDAYEAAYAAFEEPAACDLARRIDQNAGILTYDVWGDWLNEIETLFVDPSAPAAVYAKYSPLRQTFLNQLAAFFNSEASLQSYFDELWNAYYTGSQTPITNPCGPNEFCRFSDFDTTLAPDGWTGFVSGLGLQAILLPQGWCNKPEIPSRISIERLTEYAGSVNQVTVELSAGFSGGIGTGANTINLYDATGLVETLTITAVDTVYVFTTPFSSDRILIDVNYDAAAEAGRPVPASIINVKLEGTGINRYGVNNC